MTGSVRCELHAINGKTYCNHQRRCEDKIFCRRQEKTAVFHFAERNRCRSFDCSVINTAQANGIDIKEYLTNLFRTGERRVPLKSE